MTSSRIFYLALVLSALGIAFGIHTLLRSSLRELLGKLANVDGVAGFYERVFLVGLTLTCVGWALDAGIRADAELTVMDRLWDYADGLGDVLIYASLFLLAFTVLITILVSALGRHRER